MANVLSGACAKIKKQATMLKRSFQETAKRYGFFWATTLWAAAGPARGDIHLRLEPVTEPVPVGQVAVISLIGRNDLPTVQPVSTVEAMLNWDPAVLRLLGVTDPTPSPWIASGFLADPDGFNDSLSDGDAQYTAIASPSSPANFPANGERVITQFRFEVLSASPETTIELVAEQGDFGRTRVFAPSPPQNDVTGTIQGTTLLTIACDSGDVDSDGDVDLVDVADFQVCFSGSQLASADCACLFDHDHDGDVDRPDWESLAALISGPVP